MKYQEFLKEIYAKSAGKKKLQLKHIRDFLNAVGNPEKELEAVHIGGTNGKGSTAAMVESILDRHNFKTGLNTSPHLVNYNERFRLNKKLVAEERLLNQYLEFRDLHEKFGTSYFEITTIIAFQIFLAEQVDYAIMEVGMGGRLDASVLVNAVITAITNIDYDHMKSLGSTLPEIAGEKAGILKEGIPVVLGKMPNSAREVIVKRAEKLDAPILEAPKVVEISNVTLNRYGNKFDVKIPKYDLNIKDIECNLSGKHQLDNAATAILICANLAERFGWDLQPEKLRQGLKSVRWEGRMQEIQKKPQIVVDGAHNPGGIEKLVYNLTHLYDYEKLIVVIAIFYDKDFRTMIKNLSSIVDTFVICQSHSERAAQIDDLSHETEKYTDSFIIEKDIKVALKKAKEIANEDDLICVTGSLHTIGEVLEEVKGTKREN